VGDRIVFAQNDDRSQYTIKVDQDMSRANAFAIDFDFSFDPSLKDNSWLDNHIIAEIAIVPTSPTGEAIVVNLTDTVVDLTYGQWTASEGLGITGYAEQQDSYVLGAGHYNAHIEIKTIDDRQYFIAVISTIEADGSLTDLGITSARLLATDFKASRDFDVFIDGSVASGVSALDNFELALTRLPVQIDGLEGTEEDDLIFGTAGADKMYGFAGNDTIRGFRGDDEIYGGTGHDKIVGGLGDDIIDGGAGDDYLLGQTGDDTIYTGGGSDEVYGGFGDDTIYITEKSGGFTDTINGGGGTDTLNINYGGITSLRDFTISRSGNVTTLTDSSGGSINFENIDKLYIAEHPISLIENSLSNGLWSPDEYLINALSGSWWGVGRMGTEYGLSGMANINLSISDDITYIASEGQQRIALNVEREEVGDMSMVYVSGAENSYIGNLTISMGDSSDIIEYAHFKNEDSVDMGSGDDRVSFGWSSADWSDGFGSLGMPEFDDFSMLNFDGGIGSDTLDFSYSGTSTDGKDLLLTFGNATNFENIIGTGEAEKILGDSNANELSGGGGSDILYGYAGDDILYGDRVDWMDEGASWASGDDKLYGGAGDDSLYGTAGENILDGGTGQDIMIGGNGADTFVLRAGDGSSTLANADVITDFKDGVDVFGMDDGLAFNDLIITEGTGDNSNDALVSIAATDEYLAIVEGVNALDLTEADFTPVDIV